MSTVIDITSKMRNSEVDYFHRRHQIEKRLFNVSRFSFHIDKSDSINENRSKRNKSCPEALVNCTVQQSEPRNDANNQKETRRAHVHNSQLNGEQKENTKPKANSFSFTAGLRKLRKSIRIGKRKKISKQTNQSNTESVQHQTMTKQNSDSGVDTCKGSVNPSITSNSLRLGQDTTGNNPGTDLSSQNSPIIIMTPEPLLHAEPPTPLPRKNSKKNSRPDSRTAPVKVSRLINYQSDLESVVSSRYSSRIKTKPKIRNARRKKSKNSSRYESAKNSTMTSSRPSSAGKSTGRTTSPDFNQNVQMSCTRGESTMLLDDEINQINQNRFDEVYNIM